MKAVKLSETVIDIACTYGKSVNKGILNMQTRNQELEREVTRLKGISDELQKKVLETRFQGAPVFDVKYWSKMKEVIVEVFHDLQR